VKLTPIQFLVSGFFMVLFGLVVPYLMVVRIIQPTFFLSFLSFAASFTGLMFGLVGVATYTREHRNRDR
jgi:positive regulator of sigma E activity